MCPSRSQTNDGNLETGPESEEEEQRRRMRKTDANIGVSGKGRCGKSGRASQRAEVPVTGNGEDEVERTAGP